MSNGEKKYKAISKHSVTRGKQRLGNTKNGISLAAKRPFMMPLSPDRFVRAWPRQVA